VQVPAPATMIPSQKVAAILLLQPHCPRVVHYHIFHFGWGTLASRTSVWAFERCSPNNQTSSLREYSLLGALTLHIKPLGPSWESGSWVFHLNRRFYSFFEWLASSRLWCKD
jgi:hypothetical protein